MGSEYDQSTLYACMEISQRDPFVQLIYANGSDCLILMVMCVMKELLH
jgi:hypothetical protein